MHDRELSVLFKDGIRSGYCGEHICMARNISMHIGILQKQILKNVAKPIRGSGLVNLGRFTVKFYTRRTNRLKLKFRLKVNWTRYGYLGLNWDSNLTSLG